MRRINKDDREDKESTWDCNLSSSLHRRPKTMPHVLGKDEDRLGEKEIRKITKNKRIPVLLFSFSSLRRFFLRESVHIKRETERTPVRPAIEHREHKAREILQDFSKLLMGPFAVLSRPVAAADGTRRLGCPQDYWGGASQFPLSFVPVHRPVKCLALAGPKHSVNVNKNVVISNQR